MRYMPYLNLTDRITLQNLPETWELDREETEDNIRLIYWKNGIKCGLILQAGHGGSHPSDLGPFTDVRTASAVVDNTTIKSKMATVTKGVSLGDVLIWLSTTRDEEGKLYANDISLQNKEVTVRIGQAPVFDQKPRYLVAPINLCEFICIDRISIQKISPEIFGEIRL